MKDPIRKSMILLVVVNTTVCVACFVLIATILRTDISWVFLLLAAFATAISGFLVLYQFYFVDVTGRMNILSEKIRMRYLQNEIPSRSNLLEEVDGLKKLEERVDFLIESREREVAQFENLDSYRKEYLGNVSHELKTPVFNIQGYIDTLLNGGLEDPEVNISFLQKAEKSIDRLINIIDDLETITQLESGVLELDIETFDIAAQCRDIFSSMEMMAAREQVALELAKKYEKPVLVRADKFRIRQVLVNLISNSLKYGRPGGTTSISFTYMDDDVVVEVSDNGEGIAEEHLPRIFERFYRVDKGRSREQGGTGLGLAIVKHIIEAHSKSIRVSSTRGFGTVFTFSLQAA